MLARLFSRLVKWRRPRSLGQQGERAAGRYLRRCGYHIVARSQRGVYGEIDLIAVDREVVVFVEVKTRRSAAKGDPVEAVDARKQGRITRQALAFLKRHHLLEYACRFDIVAITWPHHCRRPQIKHYINAFEPTGCKSFFT